MLLKDIQRIYGIDIEKVKTEYISVKNALAKANFNRNDLHDLDYRYGRSEKPVYIKLGGMKLHLIHIEFSIIHFHPVYEDGSESEIVYNVVDWIEGSSRVLTKSSRLIIGRHRFNFHFKDNGEISDDTHVENW